MIRFFEKEQRHLFDLSADVSERHDLATTKPDILASLDRRLTEYLMLVRADLPTPNPNFDPAGERSGDRKGGGNFNRKERKERKGGPG